MSIQDHRSSSNVLLALFNFAAISCSAQIESASDAAEVVAESAALAKCPPAIPEALAIPAGNRLAFSLGASGVQRYTCTDNAGVTSWVFSEPEADLFDKHGRIAGSHYKGPTWEGRDGSTVVAAMRLAAVTVDPASIPWLALQATAHTGSGRMSNLTFVQRLNTKGGLAPAGACAAGAVLDVDYTATYAFYETRPAKAR